MCVVLERILLDSGNYQGYQDLYWNEIGFQQWLDNGKPEYWHTKSQYIYGLPGSKYNGSKFSRRYY